MNRPQTLVLVRHGESLRNVAKKNNVYFPDDESRSGLRGVPDHKIPLTPRGREQALKTGIFLRQRFGYFDYAYHSGYLRTIDTMQGLLEAYPPEERYRIKVRMNPYIRERDPGYTYDMTTEEAEKAFPWLREHWQTFGGFFARPPGGESIADVCKRAYLFLNMLFRDRAGLKILVVLHGGSIRAMMTHFERLDYDAATELFHKRTPPGNCSVTHFEYDGGKERLMLRSYNQAYW